VAVRAPKGGRSLLQGWLFAHAPGRNRGWLLARDEPQPTSKPIPSLEGGRLLTIGRALALSSVARSAAPGCPERDFAADRVGLQRGGRSLAIGPQPAHGSMPLCRGGRLLTPKDAWRGGRSLTSVEGVALCSRRGGSLLTEVGAEGDSVRVRPQTGEMPDVAPRQRSLIPFGVGGAIEGWMDDDVASAATQLFSSGPSGLLVIDARELLTSTARVVGVELGELHFKVWMAIITLHVAHGMPADGRGEATAAELGRIIWGADREQGGSNTKKLLKALFDLSNAKFTVPGYDMVHQRPAASVSSTSLLINLAVDDTMLKAFTEAGRHHLDRAQFGAALGAKQRGTISWRLHPDYSQRLAESDLRRFDWTKAQQLRGVALALWMVFSSPRVPYREVFESRAQMEMVEVPLTREHCLALGVRAASDAARRRTLNDAGRRVAAADKSFAAFEAHGGRGCHSFLRIVRNRPRHSPPDPPVVVPAEQLTLAA